MKERYYLVLLLFISFGSYSQSNIMFGIKAGYNRSQLMGDGYNGYYKQGFQEGIFSQLKLTENLSLQIELVLTNKGCSAYHSKNATINSNTFYANRLYYLEAPILLHVHFNKFIFNCGPGLGVMVWHFDMEPAGKTHYLSPVPSLTEISGNIGIGYKINQKWTGDLRYSHSLLPIRVFPTKQYNSVFSLAMLYTIYEKNKNRK